MTLEELSAAIAGALREAVREEVAAAMRSGPSSRRLLSIEEAAESCGIARSTFYGLVDRGEVETVYIGSRRLVPTASLDEFIARGGTGR